MRRTGRSSHFLVGILLLGLSPIASAFPLDWSFKVLPGPDIFGAPGQTVGFGYQITNLDEQNWLVTSFLDAGSFLHATPLVIFDFPILAPLQIGILPYNPLLHLGLYEVALDLSAPLGFVNSGVFTLTSDFYDGDPFGGGQVLFPGLFLDAPYSVTVGANPIPEPSFTWFVLTGVLLAAGFRVRSRLGTKLTSKV